MIIRHIFLSAILITAFSLSSQIHYQDDIHISIVGEADPNYGITIHGTRGINHYANSLFLVDIEHTYCYIRGLGWGFYFYNPDTETYNDICAHSVLQHTNGEIYDDWNDDSDISILSQLTPVSYTFKTNSTSTPYSKDDNARHIGFIAQEVEQIIPESVSNDEYGHKYVNYNAFIPYIFTSIRHLSKKINVIESQIEDIRKSYGMTSEKSN